jgi:hypothetical protein
VQSLQEQQSLHLEQFVQEQHFIHVSHFLHEQHLTHLLQVEQSEQHLQSTHPLHLIQSVFLDFGIFFLLLGIYNILIYFNFLNFLTKAKLLFFGQPFS